MHLSGMNVFAGTRTLSPMLIYKVCPESTQPCTMKNRHLLKKVQETLYIGQWHLSPLQIGTLGPHTVPQSPSAAPSHIFPESHWWSEISSLWKVMLVLGKVRSHRAPNLGCRGAESPEWLDVSPKNCVRRDAWAGTLLWWSCQSPVAHSCGLLKYPNSFHAGLFKFKTQFDVDSFLYSLILNVMIIKHTHSLNSVYHPH